MPEKPAYETLEKRILQLEQEISALSKMQKELKESEACFSEMFDHMPSGVAIYKPVDDSSDFVFK